MGASESQHSQVCNTCRTIVSTVSHSFYYECSITNNGKSQYVKRCSCGYGIIERCMGLGLPGEPAMCMKCGQTINHLFSFILPNGLVIYSSEQLNMLMVLGFLDELKENYALNSYNFIYSVEDDFRDIHLYIQLKMILEIFIYIFLKRKIIMLIN